MHVLITNDDGIHSRGLEALAAALSPVARISVVAPDREQSAASHAISLHRPLRIVEVGPGRWSVDGTPTDAVYMALHHLLAGDGPDLVVSGINHGANLADDVTYSGTVGAGLEAAILGTSAVCLSQQTPSGSFSVNYHEDLAGLAYDFGFSAQHGAGLARSVVGARPAEPVVLSVNYPAHRIGSATVLTRAGRRDWPRASVPDWPDDQEVHRLYLFGEPDEPILEADGSLGTDIGALRAGHISVTPLSFAVELADLPPGFQSFLGRLHTSFPITDVLGQAG